MRSRLWYVYLARCSDDTLYTGITNNLERRFRQHNGELAGGARYTASRRPVILAWMEEVQDRGSASRREMEVRNLSREKKIKLIARNKFISQKGRQYFQSNHNRENDLR